MISFGVDRCSALLLHRSFLHFLFVVFALVVVHACQRMVEHATQHIEPAERRAGLSRVSFCIGSLTWALDLVGYLMYPWARIEDARLVPALMALVLMLLLARVMVPMFASTQSSGTVWTGSLGMGGGVIGVHILVATSLGQRPVGVSLVGCSMGVALTMAIALGMSALHRPHHFHRMKPAGFQAVSWQVKIAAALGVVVLHRILNAAVPLGPTRNSGFPGAVPALLVVVLFAVIVGVDQALDVNADHKRREVFERAFALLRSASVPATGERGRQLSLVAERVEGILEGGSFRMLYQPIVTLGGGGGGVRFEALMRVEHKDLGSIHPELFFLACERKGLTSRADRTVLRKALESSMPWIHDVPQCMGIAVNFGPQTLLEAGFVPWLEGVLGELGVPRNWLQIEITEHALVAGSGPLAGVLGDLRSLGVGTYLDDFGAGFSSLGLLPHLPIAGIKCDRNLLQGAADDPARHVILEKICQMAGAMGIGTTVEGIETQEDLDVVRACGATGGQGYLLGRPMPPADVSAWVSAYANPEKLRGVALQCAPV